MMRHTGGLAVGDISTKSNPPSSAACKASRVDTIPAWLPSTSIKRTSGTLICSLIRARSFSRLVGALMFNPPARVTRPLIIYFEPLQTISWSKVSHIASIVITPKSTPSRERRAT